MKSTEIATPVFLRECDAYHNYLARGRAGTLRLPGYEKVSHPNKFMRLNGFREDLLSH